MSQWRWECSQAKNGIVSDTLAGFTKAQSERQRASWGSCVGESVFSICPILLPLLLFPCFLPFICRWVYSSPLHACIKASLKWANLGMPLVSIAAWVSRMSFRFSKLWNGSFIKAPLIFIYLFTAFNILQLEISKGLSLELQLANESGYWMEDEWMKLCSFWCF